MVGASSREAADRIAGAFMALGMVRAGRQRVKVIAVGRRAPTGDDRPADPVTYRIVLCMTDSPVSAPRLAGYRHRPVATHSKVNRVSATGEHGQPQSRTKR